MGDGRAVQADTGVAALVELSLLRGFELVLDGALVDLPWNAQRLLAFLALNDRPLLRAHVAGSLWIDKSEERAGANLRSALWRLRQTSEALVDAVGSHLRLATTVQVDIHTAESLCRRLMTPDELATDAAWADQLTGELLPDWYDDWVVNDRERLRQLFLHALERLCIRLCTSGSYGAAIDVGFRAIAVEPLRETAHRVLIAAYLAEGNQCEALRQYERYRLLLHEQLDLAPSASMDEMVSPLLARAG